MLAAPHTMGEARSEGKQKERNVRRRQSVKKDVRGRERKRANTNLEARLVG